MYPQQQQFNKITYLQQHLNKLYILNNKLSISQAQLPQKETHKIQNIQDQVH